MAINIAIDGPSAAGKSSLAKSIATKLGYIHLDTGAMYRMVAFLCKTKEIEVSEEASILKALSDCNYEISKDGNFYLNGQCISEKIRSEEIGMLASEISKHPRIREALVARQRLIAKKGGYILDGRDIGTVVLPDAEVKIFLKADAKERARRRVSQHKQKGIDLDYDEVLADIEKRDYQDTHREVSPLKRAKDAIVIDSSTMNLDEVIEVVYDIVNKKLKELR